MAIRIPLTDGRTRGISEGGSYHYKFTLTNIPVGTAHVTSRSIFRVPTSSPAVQHCVTTVTTETWLSRAIKHIGEMFIACGELIQALGNQFATTVTVKSNVPPTSIKVD